jgi:AhpD family alkylhydroperoxidase
MSRLLKSFDNLSLKVVAVRTADDSDFGFEFPANSPASLRAYIRADAALVRGLLTPRKRLQVALAVAEINGSSYSLSAHHAMGKSLGLTHQEMRLARNATV